MATIINERMTAEIDGEFVVFLIGARINKPWKIHKWLPVARAMPRMIKELEADPESGYLGGFGGPTVMVQYWRSFEHLENFARDASDPHAKTWREYYRRHAAHGEGAGIWHETFLVRAGEYEAIYNNMPPFGLGKAGRLVPVAESSTARLRIRARDAS